jgi:hypothetical protein
MERKKITRDYWNHLSETVSVSGVRHAYKEAAMSFELGSLEMKSARWCHVASSQGQRLDTVCLTMEAKLCCG